MSKTSKYYAKKRAQAQKAKVLPRDERKRREEIERIVARAKSRKNDKAYQAERKAAFYNDYFQSLRPENTSKIYPSMMENKQDSGATAKKGILAQRAKLNGMDPEIREREERAIAEAEARAKSVAPAYNKGGYQPVSQSDLHTMGRKI